MHQVRRAIHTAPSVSWSVSKVCQLVSTLMSQDSGMQQPALARLTLDVQQPLWLPWDKCACMPNDVQVLR